MDKNDYKIALLIDSENISAKHMDDVMNELSKYGTVVLARFYGDIVRLNEWRDVALKYSIKPMHQYNVATGKNSADMAMALDALDIMYQGRVNCFFIVSSDSDFTPLASKLREYDMFVVGIGSEKQVTPAFRSSCNLFKYFEYLGNLETEEVKVENGEKEKEKENIEIEKTIRDIIIESGTENKMLLSNLGNILLKRYSDFDTRKYGASSLSSLINTFTSVKIDGYYATLIMDITKADIDKESFEMVSIAPNHQLALNKLKQALEKRFPSFDYLAFGFTKFSIFVKSIHGLKVEKNLVTLAPNADEKVYASDHKKDHAPKKNHPKK